MKCWLEEMYNYVLGNLYVLNKGEASLPLKRAASPSQAIVRTKVWEHF